MSSADFNNRELIEVGNEHLFAFMRNHPERQSEEVLIVANFDASLQHLNLSDLRHLGRIESLQLRDLVTGDSPEIFKDELVIPPYSFYWLSDHYTSSTL